MSYNIKIDKRTTNDGVTSWLEWNGVALNAWAEWVSKDRMYKSIRQHLVSDPQALVVHFPPDERRFTTPELFARRKAVKAVRDDREAYFRGEREKVAQNGGW